MGRILFANHYADYTARVTTMLERDGHRVDPMIESGANLLEAATRRSIDLIIIDCELGGPLTAEQALALLGDMPGRPPLLFLGRPRTPIEAHAPDRIVPKPFTAEMLCSAVNELLLQRSRS